jgi:antagonist of KipI
MTTRAVEVLRPGLLTTVQDGGRWGHQAVGVPVSGAMDTAALRQANAWVGNADEAAALEVTLLGPRLRAHGDLTVAMAGASFALDVDGRAVRSRGSFPLPAGAVLTFGRRSAGARAYLAIAGGIDVPLVLGSRSTHLVSGMGGLDGRALRTGDVVPVGVPVGRPPGGRASQPSRAPTAVVETPGPRTLRVVLGPQQDWFTAASLDALGSATFVVSPRSDRMGYRLDGPSLVARRREELVSEPVPFGAIQVPPGGAPILLMADRQTAGGYPKIATVIAADLPAAGQLAPADTVRFAVCTRAEALAALIVRERALLRTAAEAETP